MTHRHLQLTLKFLYRDIAEKERELAELRAKAARLEEQLEARELRAMDREFQRDRV